MSKSYSPSLLKGKDEKVSHPSEADRMLININEMKTALELEDKQKVQDVVRSQMKKFGFKGDLRVSDNEEYLIAYKATKFSFEV
jgi:hypothetical protein